MSLGFHEGVWMNQQGGAEGPQLPVLGGVRAEKESKCLPFWVVCPARGSVGPPLTMPFASYEGLTWCWEAARAVGSLGQKTAVLSRASAPRDFCLQAAGGLGSGGFSVHGCLGRLWLRHY